MAQGDILVEGDSGRELAVVEVPTAAGGVAKAHVFVQANLAGAGVTPLTAVTEDAVAPADPSGVQLMARQRAAPASESAANGDNVALNATGKGELFVKDTDLAAVLPPARGQQTSANSTSVVLASDAAIATSPITSTQWQYAAASGGISNTTTAVPIKAADATLRNYITSIQIIATALGAATEIAIRDGAGGAVLWRGYIGTAGALGGMEIAFQVPLKGTAATLLEVVTLTASITGSVYVNAQGFTAA